MKLLAVAATDSHLKWAAHFALGAPRSWRVEVVVLDGAGTPSERQVAAALSGTGLAAPATIGLAELRRRLRRRPVDALVLACTGPVIAAVDQWVLRWLRVRPVVVSVTPGIAVPVRERAIRARRAVDVFVAHSRAERRAYRSAFAVAGAHTEVALAHLPSLPDRREVTVGTDVVFATQAAVPADLDQRRLLLASLVRAAPSGVVVHERAAAGEETAHRERHPYRAVWDELVTSGRFDRSAVEFVSGPFSRSLARARCVVSVSSTALLEAVAAGVPIGVIGDFGVDDRLLNGVFAGSGCVVDLGRDGLSSVQLPDPSWARDHYFHDSGENDMVDIVERAVARASIRRGIGSPPSSLVPATKWVVRSTWQRHVHRGGLHHVAGT